MFRPRQPGIFCQVVKKVTKLYIVLMSYVLLGLVVLPKCQAVKQKYYAHNKLTCSQPHYYETDSTFIVHADGHLVDHKCEIVFTQSQWTQESIAKPCYSICVRVLNYTMNSCDFQMAYYDGLGDIHPRKFDCHTFPSYFWCTSKNDLKIKFVELRKYKGEGYDIALEIKTICTVKEKTPAPVPKEETYNERFLKEEKRQRDTVIITGSLVSTVSFLFVIFWITYCCWKRRSPRGDANSRSSENTTPKSQSSSGGYSGHILRKPTSNHQNSLSNPPPFREENTHQWYPMHGMNHPAVYPPKYIQPNYTTTSIGSPSKHNDTGYESQIDARYTKMPGTLHEDDENDEEVVSYFPNCQSAARQSPIKDVRFQDDPDHRRYVDNFRKFIPQRQQSPGRDTDFHQSEVRQQLVQHPYDADAEMPYDMEAPPPLPPRPLLATQPAKQYFI
ncbi:hypothetical protein KUTeg_020417 [Tegillarca granosa]|uniref:CUB domain-containing protein n=1 Tax=Tegillarca granosa TaxID=220873 RepID=A0ABQ9E8D3_TEGGR|nr:hypothetical protein KUTeg_020417 [Tegillarca granosa]